VKWFRWSPSRARLAPEHEAALQSYGALPAVDARTDALALRLVVVDVETTGLRPYRDRLLAIGAVAVQSGLLRLDDTFETTIRQTHPSDPETILVHGSDGTTQTSGTDATDALLAFLEFAGKAPLIGFHADFDRVFLTRAMRETLHTAPLNPWLDLADLAPAVLPEHAEKAQTLDEWMQRFDIENPARHEALADAVATAQLLQVVLAHAARRGISRLSDLTACMKGRRWLTQSLRVR